METWAMEAMVVVGMEGVTDQAGATVGVMEVVGAMAPATATGGTTHMEEIRLQFCYAASLVEPTL